MASRRRKSSDLEDMRNRIVGKKATQEENVIPMINIIFLLLLYFMIAGNLQPDYDVAPPFSTQTQEPSSQIPTLSINADGTMRFEGQPISWAKFEAKIGQYTGHEKLKVHADAKLDALTISKVMRTASDAGILQFVLVTQKRVEAG